MSSKEKVPFLERNGIFFQKITIFALQTQRKWLRPNGKKGSQKHQDVQNAEYDKLSQEYDGSKTVEVAKEVTVSTPNGKKKHRIADVAAYTKDQPFEFCEIVQIGKTDKDGNPVKREQEAIEDIEKHTKRKVKFVDYENYDLDATE